MTVILLGVFSEMGRPVLSLINVSMSLIMTQKHFPRLTTAMSTLLSPTLESLLLLLLLSLNSIPWTVSRLLSSFYSGLHPNQCLKEAFPSENK